MHRSDTILRAGANSVFHSVAADQARPHAREARHPLRVPEDPPPAGWQGKTVAVNHAAIAHPCTRPEHPGPVEKVSPEILQARNRSETALDSFLPGSALSRHFAHGLISESRKPA